MAVGREKLFLCILVFFAIVTAITGAVNLIQSGAVKLGDMGSSNYMQTIPGQVAPDLSITGLGSVQMSSQNFTYVGGFNPNFTTISNYLLAGDMFARADGVGYYSVYTDYMYPNLAFLNLKGVTPTDGIYDVTYHIYNQFDSYPVYLLISANDQGNGFSRGFFVRVDKTTISSVFDNDLEHPMQIEPIYSFFFPKKIETKFNPSTESVEVWLDDVHAATLTQWSYGGFSAIGSSADGSYNGGVATGHTGLQVSQVDSNFQLKQTVSSWDQFIAFASGAVNLVFAFFGLTSNALVPFWLWAIIALPCIATLVLIWIEIARGV